MGAERLRSTAQQAIIDEDTLASALKKNRPCNAKQLNTGTKHTDISFKLTNSLKVEIYFIFAAPFMHLLPYRVFMYCLILLCAYVYSVYIVRYS